MTFATFADRLQEMCSMEKMMKASASGEKRLPAAPFTAILALAALTLGGCAARKAPEIQAQIPDNYTERHPIVLGDVSRQIDVFLASNGGLGYRQEGDVREFVRQYRQNGKGALVATLPAGAPPGPVHQTLAEIRRIAAGGGVSSNYIRVEPTGPTFPSAAAIRLHYAGLEAKLASKCGQYPFDASGGATLQSWENRPMYNLGCSYQSHIAAQVADPVDIVRSRPEGPIDVQKRMQGIENIREGKDPTTKWPAEKSQINQALK